MVSDLLAAFVFTFCEASSSRMFKYLVKQNDFQCVCYLYIQHHHTCHAFGARDIPGRISKAKTLMKQVVSRTYRNVVFCDDSALGFVVADRR